MSYRALLRAASPGFFVLAFLARLPYAAAPIATLILLVAATGSYAFAGLAGATQAVALAAGGPLVGALADRYGHRRLGATTAISNVAALAGLIAATQAGRPVMLAAATVAGLTQPPIGALIRVHWSHRAHELLPTALSYETAADETTFIAGPLLVGLLTPLGATAPTVLIMALLSGATLPFALRYVGGPVPRPDRPAGRLRLAPLAAMVVAMAAMGAVFGAVQTGVTAYANDVGQPGVAGLLYAELGVGSVLAGAACGWLPRRFTLRWRYVAFTAALLAGMLPLLVVPPPVAIAAAGVAVAPYLITLYAITDRLAPPHQTTVAMTVLCAGGPLGTAAGRAVAGSLAEDHGTLAAFAVAPAAAAVALLLAVAVAARWSCDVG